MRLILSGGGSGKDTEELDESFANLVNKNKDLLYIPIAIDNYKHPYPECLIWLKNTFVKLGINKYKVLTEENIDDFSKKDPSEFGGIYIGGGNTPYLLKKLKESGMWEFIKRAIKKDIPIYGGSAGAIIFSKSIKPSLYFDKNWVELNELEGMNLIRDHFLFCHFSPEREEKIIKIISNEKLYPAILLPETSGIYVTEKEIKLLGNKDVEVINENGTKDKFSLKEL